ncbi:MAG TPA: VWA domain-containing protein [Planctomycetota bacterium]|nr:VWA domain-containing protein [Planctomycetota bacterium]
MTRATASPMKRLLGLPAHVLRRLVPAPRRAVRARGAAPLVIFLALYAAAAITLVMRDIAAFAAPAAFAWMLVTPWVWWLHAAGWGGLGGGRAQVALIVRLSLIGLAVAILAEPRAVRVSDGLSVMYCIDRSDSIGQGAADGARRWMLATVADKPATDEAGLAVFGREAAIELPPRQSFPFEAFTTRVARDGTDLARALALAAAVIPEERNGRIVLVSDGAATQGDLDRTLDQLAQRGIAVDVLPVAYDHSREVWAEKISLPRDVRVGETYEAGVLVSALDAGAGELVLRENGREIARSPVSWRAGKNRFSLPLYLRTPGYYEYAATIEPAAGADGWSENNTTIGYVNLEGEGRVLVLTDPEGEPADAQPLAKALREHDLVVDLMTAYECPGDALAMLPYDAIALVNVPADALDPTQQQAIHDAVYDLGVGLVMVGGKNGFGPGGWNRTPVETCLPVSMDISQRKVLPKGALAIVLHTCEFADGNTWAKRITKEAMKVLGAKDEVGVIDYDYQGGVQWVFPLTEAAEYDRIAPLVEQAEPGDMPSFTDTMELALTGLKASDAATRHVIIISDGDPSPPPPELIERYVAAKITISAVTVFPHGNTEPPAFRAIALATGGRSYFPNDPGKLPAIFIKEAKTLKRSQIQNIVFVPKAGMPSPIMKGIDAVPALQGYVLTTPKSGSQTILEGPDEEEDDPVLALWRYGIGASAAWTSDLGPNWGTDWVGWERYAAFVQQLFTAIARSERRGRLRMSAEPDGDVGTIIVSDTARDAGFLALRARVGLPDASHADVELRPVAPGRYQGTFRLAGKGRYQVVVAGGDGEQQERAVGGFVVPYSAEYLRFRSDPFLLRRIAERTGGRELTGDEDGAALYDVPRQRRASSRPIFDLLLVLLACLLPLDVAVRRVQIDWSAIAARLRGRRAAPTATMSALLGAKQRAAQGNEARSVEMPLPPAPSRGEALGPAPKPAPRAPAPPPPPAGSASSMAGRLLEAKRRRQQEQDDKPS